MNQNESGRSMVEMLGVLAVMGLLTIIGIAGFKMAMNKAKANNLVADMNRLAHIVVMDKFSGYSEEAIENAVAEHNQKTEYQAEYEYRTPQVFAIKTKNAIDKTLCQQVASLGWQLPLATYLNKVKIEGTFDEERCTDENELIWAFTNDFSACPDCALGDFDCTPYANRECGTCDSIGYTPKNEDCANNANGQYCLEGKCQECVTNQAFDNRSGSCQTCTNSDYFVSSALYKHACLETMFFMGGTYLVNCSWSDSTDADELSCKRCANRCFDANQNNLCAMAGTNKRYTRDENGNCVCKNLVNGKCLCPTNQALNNHGSCESCTSSWYMVSSDKQACPGTMFSAGPYLFGCQWGDATNADEGSCIGCTNRCFDADHDNTCRIMGSAYTRDENGHCVAN